MDAEAANHALWLVCDCRHRGDFRVFETRFPGRCVRVRVEAALETRRRRGFVYVEGVDDNDSECGLDDPDGGFDFIIQNDGEEKPETLFKDLFNALR